MTDSVKVDQIGKTRDVLRSVDGSFDANLVQSGPNLTMMPSVSQVIYPSNRVQTEVMVVDPSNKVQTANIWKVQV